MPVEVTRVDALDFEILQGLLRTVIVLLVLAPIIYGVTRLYGVRRTKGASIEIKEAVSLGGQRGLYVVDWEGSRYLLGVTQQQIVVLERAAAATRSREEEAVVD